MAASFLDRESTVAPANYNRFLVPPAALAVHLSIGQAYAFSTFNLPLTKLLGITRAMAHIGRTRRREIETMFARELDRLPTSERKPITDALDVAASGRTWDALRRDMKLSISAARDVIEKTLAKPNT